MADNIEAKELTELTAEVKGLSGKIETAVKAEAKAITENVDAKVKGLETSISTTDETIGKVKSQVETVQAELKELKQKAGTQGFGGGGQKSFADQVGEQLTANADNLAQKGKKAFGFEVSMSTKAVGNFSSSGSLTGSYFVPPTVVPGVVAAAFNEVHMRNILSTGTTNSNVIRHIRDNGGEGGPAITAEGGSKPQMDRDLSIVDANVRKIATHMRLPEEMVTDIPYLTSFLSEIGTEEVLAVEDTQILYGDGTGNNISGLFTNATAFAAGGVVIGASANNYDALGWAATQMRIAKRMPSIILVNPLDYYEMVTTKDANNNYILQGGGNGIQPNIGGVPVVQMNQVAADDFLVVDRRAAQIFFRENISVRFYEQDQDNAIKNLITIVIEERLALPIYFTAGLIKGTFTAALADLAA